MQQGVEELIERRMKRALAAILGAKEREVDAYLPAHLAAKMRRVILDEMNDFAEVVMDIVESLDDDTVALNEHWLNLIGEIHRATVGSDEADEAVEMAST